MCILSHYKYDLGNDEDTELAFRPPRSQFSSLDAQQQRSKYICFLYKTHPDTGTVLAPLKHDTIQ